MLPMLTTSLITNLIHNNQDSFTSCVASILRILTIFTGLGGVGKELKLWSVQELGSEEGSLLLQDEMELDAAIVSAAFDDVVQLGKYVAR